MAMELNEAQRVEVSRIRARIETLIKTHFATGKPAYYLSNLGNQLGETDRKLLESLTRTKLSQFVADAFDYEIGRSGQHDNILYLVAPEGTTVSSEAIPRYNSRFWAAFVVPLSESQRRFIDIETCEFSDDPGDLTSQGDHVREIDARFLTKGADPATPDAILNHIAEWLQAQKLDQAPFLLQRNKHHSKNESLLSALINALDKDQLKRVSLPLDVIKALEARRS